MEFESFISSKLIVKLVQFIIICGTFLMNFIGLVHMTATCGTLIHHNYILMHILLKYIQEDLVLKKTNLHDKM